MKKFLVICLIFTSIFLCGFKNKRPLVLTSSMPITQENQQYLTKYFEINQKIYYAILFPRGLKKGVYRVQFFTKDDKSEFWGYKHSRHYDFKVSEKDTKYLSDYLVMLQKGHYIVQVFNLDNVNKPIALGDFWVKWFLMK